MKIVRAEIRNLEPHLHGPLKPSQMISLALPTVHVWLEDGTERDLFRYYPDEISFSAEEFIGLTPDEARDLFYKRDLAYLRS